MGIEESYQVAPPCNTAACVPPQGPNVVYERAYDQYGRPIVVVHQRPPPLTQMSYANTNYHPPMQATYPAPMHAYQPPPPYAVHTTNPYATVSAAQYPGQYAPMQPSPGTLLTSPGYYYMPATTQPTATAPNTAHLAPSALSSNVPLSSPVQPLAYPAPPHAVAPSPPPHASLVPNTMPSSSAAQQVSNTNLSESRANIAAEHVIMAETSKEREVTLPGLTPLVSNMNLQRVSNSDPQRVSNTDLSNADPQQVSNTGLSNTGSQQASHSVVPTDARVNEQQRANDTLTPDEPEPLVSFSNVTVTPTSLLPGIETKFNDESDAKNSSGSTDPPSEVNNSTESPVRVKKSFNPLPRSQPTVKAYLAHEEL